MSDILLNKKNLFISFSLKSMNAIINIIKKKEEDSFFLSRYSV